MKDVEREIERNRKGEKMKEVEREIERNRKRDNEINRKGVRVEKSFFIRGRDTKQELLARYR